MNNACKYIKVGGLQSFGIEKKHNPKARMLAY
jgi:hypothetical protein